MGEMMAQIPLENLELAPAVSASLRQAGYQLVDDVADLTISQLENITGLENQAVQELLAQVDFFYDRLCQSRLLCPCLPPAAYDLEIETLELEPDVLEILARDGISTLHDLALMSRDALAVVPGLTSLMALDVEFALTAFVDSYRKEDIVLMEEDEELWQHETGNDTGLLTDDAFDRMMTEYESATPRSEDHG